MKSNIGLLDFILKWRFVIALLFATAILLLEGCKKGDSPTEQVYEQYFEQNVLNSDFVVHLALENSVDITADYTGWVFRLLKTTYYNGPMTAVKNGVTYTGTWQCTTDYGKLTIQIDQPTIPSGFTFINREWRFAKKELPIMQFAPWGSSADTKLHMRRL
jgi:hypothetical protein